MKSKEVLKNVLYPLVALALFLGVWAIAAAAINKPIILPSVEQTFAELFALLGGADFWRATGATILRSLRSFLYGFAGALALSAVGALFKPFHRVLSPIVTVLRAAPTMAVILLAMLWLDYEDVPILIGFLIAFPLLYSAFYSAFTGVDEELLEMARVFGLRPIDKLTSIYLPSVAPSVFDNSASTASLTVKVVIAAEVLAQTRVSIGLAMQRANLVFEVPTLLAWTIVAVVLSFAAELIIGGLKWLYLYRRHAKKTRVIREVENEA